MAVAGGLVALGNDPVRLAQDGWYRVTRQYVAVEPITATVDPPGAAAAGSAPAALVDGTVREFTMNWTPQGTNPCGAAPGTGWITLTVKPARIQRIVIYPGLADGNPERARQPVPKTVGIRFDDGPCISRELPAEPGPARLDVASGERVTRVRIGITAVHPSAPDAPALTSITEIALKTYPS